MTPRELLSSQRWPLGRHRQTVELFIAVALSFALMAIPATITTGSLADLVEPRWASSALLAIVLAALVTTDTLTLRLPDALTFPLAAAGLILTPYAILDWHIIAMLGWFAILASTAWLFERVRGYPGLGLGDAKMMAAAGAWLGPHGATSVLLSACVMALALVLAKSLCGTFDRHARLPFGPFLAVGFWFVWLYGPALLSP